MNRKIAAILAADVAGYSRLVAADEEGALRRLVEAQAVFKARVAAYRGRIFNTAGDAILAEFPSAVDATRAALEIQREMSDRNDGFAPHDRFLFRIGLNIGDVVEHEGDLLGDGVNVAARIQTLAPAGGLAISHWVREHTAGKITVPFRDIGRQSLKNIPAPVHVFVADLAPAAPGVTTPATASDAKGRSIAVKIAAAAALILALGATAVIQFRAPQSTMPSVETAKPAPPPIVEKAKAAPPIEAPTLPASIAKEPEKPAATTPPVATTTVSPAPSVPASTTPSTTPASVSPPAVAIPTVIPTPPVAIAPPTTTPKIDAARPVELPPAKTVVIPTAPTQVPTTTAPAKVEREAATPDRKRTSQTCAEVLERAQLGDVTAEDRAFLRNQCR